MKLMLPRIELLMKGAAVTLALLVTMTGRAAAQGTNEPVTLLSPDSM